MGRTDHVQRATALVLGGGTIGSLITQVLSDAGSRVTVSEPREFLKDTLLQLGAGTVVTPAELPEELFNVVFVVAGVDALVDQAFAHGKRGGTRTRGRSPRYPATA